MFSAVCVAISFSCRIFGLQGGGEDKKTIYVSKMHGIE